MKNKVNNKGFTLVELLAVLIILSAIMGIAIPSISSSMERNKDKQMESKYRMIESFAEVYVADHKNSIYNKLGSNDTCYISITVLNEGYLSDDAAIDEDGNEIKGSILFDKSNNSYTYVKESELDSRISNCN